MIVGHAPRIRQTLHTAWHTLALLFVWDLAVTIFYYVVPFRAPALPITLFGTVLALFIGFRTNSAYQRWWEGRVLWGSMINASRSVSRAIVAFLPDDDPAAVRMKRILTLRIIAYVQALRCQLRRQDPVPELVRVLGEEAGHEAALPANPANALLTGTSQAVAAVRREGLIDTIQQTQIERVMVDIANAQGGMERLKNTPLPAQYRSFPDFFTRLLCIVLPIGLVETLGWATPIGSSIAGFMFLVSLQIADDLVDPFSGTVHDLPLTAMTRTIEIDLLHTIGAPTPEPLQPVKGVLW